MTQVLLPSSVSLYHGRLWPTKDNGGKDIYRLRENNRHLLASVTEKQLKISHTLKADRVVQPLHVAVLTNTSVEVHSKPSIRTQTPSYESVELTSRRTRHGYNNEEKHLQHLDCSMGQALTAATNSTKQEEPVPTIDGLDNNASNTSCVSDIVTDSKRCIRSRRSVSIGTKRDPSGQELRRSTRHAVQKEHSSSSSKLLHNKSEFQVVADVDPKQDNLSAHVAVPTWRIINVQKRYVMEGTENITDEAYLKRHQRFETDEKRRKRWDLQRQRELSVYENMRRDDLCRTSLDSPPSPSSSDDIGIEVAYVKVHKGCSNLIFTCPLPEFRNHQPPSTKQTADVNGFHSSRKRSSSASWQKKSNIKRGRFH